MKRKDKNYFFFFSSRRRHTRLTCDWSSDVCSSDLSRELDAPGNAGPQELAARRQRESRTQGRGDHFDCRILPQVGCAGEGLYAGSATRHGSPQALRNGPAYAQSLVSRPHLTPWVRHTLTF